MLRLWPIALLAVGGCTEQLDVRYETERFRIGTEFEEELCAGNLALMERHLGFSESVLGVEVADPVELQLYATDYVDCDDGPAAGCTTYQDFVRTTWRAAFHEINHVVANEAGAPSDYFAEGFAEGFTGKETRFGTEFPSEALSLDIREMSQTSTAHFTRWLHDEHGAEKLRDLYSRSKQDGRWGHEARAFERVYGRSIEAMEEDFFDNAPELYPTLTTCDLPLVPWSGDSAESELDLDCSEEQTEGAWNGLTRRVTVDVPRADHYILELEDPARVTIEQCYPERVQAAGSLTVPTAPVGQLVPFEVRASTIEAGVTPLWLEAGLHRVSVHVDSAASTSVRFRLHRAVAPVPPASPDDGSGLYQPCDGPCDSICQIDQDGHSRCSQPCQTAQDCEVPGYAAFELQCNYEYCAIGCSTAADCPTGMLCSFDTCWWSD